MSMKKILAGIAIVGLVAAGVFLYNPLRAKMYLGKMKDFDPNTPQSFDRVRNAGVRGFIAMKGSAVPYLIEALKDSDPHVRAGAAVALGNIPPRPEAEKALIEALKNCEGDEIRAYAWALSRYGSKCAPDVAKLLDDPSPAVRAAALRVLGGFHLKKYAPRIAPFLKDESLDVAVAAARALEFTPWPPAVPDLIALARKLAAKGMKKELDHVCTALRAAVDPSVKEHVFAVLGDDSVKPLLDACRSWAGKLPPPELVPYLCKAVVSPNKVERESAFVILEGLNAADIETVALAALASSDPASRIKALEMLYDVGSEKCIKPVMAAAEDKDKEVASAALKTLGKVVARNKIGWAPVLSTSQKDNPRDEYILFAIGKLKDPALRFAATECLEALTARNGGTDYEDWNTWWYDFKNTEKYIRELSATLKRLDDINLGESKTRENFEKAKKLVEEAESLVEKLEEIAARNPKISRWVEKQRKKLNIFKYSIEKYRPLDIMN